MPRRTIWRISSTSRSAIVRRSICEAVRMSFGIFASRLRRKMEEITVRITHWSAQLFPDVFTQVRAFNSRVNSRSR